MGLLISDYIISAGNKDNTAGLSNISIAVDRRSINYNATSHDVTIITSQSQHDLPRITNSEVIFDKDDDDYIINKKADPSYLFRGMVCYYGLHYVSIFYSGEIIDNVYNFLLFDDHTIKDIGEWVDVKERCIKSRYQPVLLLYELEK